MAEQAESSKRDVWRQVAEEIFRVAQIVALLFQEIWGTYVIVCANMLV